MNIFHFILIQGVTFIAIVLFLRWLLYNQITRAVKRLQKLNQQNMQKEKILKEEIERARKEADLEIEKAKTEADKMKEEAKIESEKEREELIDKSKEEAKRVIAEAMKDVKMREKDLILEMEAKAVHIATDMVRYIFSDKNLETLHIQLIDGLIEDIKTLDVKPSSVKQDKAEVVSAFPLQEKQKEKLKTVLSSKLGKDIKLTEQSRPDVVAGLFIEMGSFLIDGSIKNKLKKVIPVMKEKVREGK